MGRSELLFVDQMAGSTVSEIQEEMVALACGSRNGAEVRKLVLRVRQGREYRSKKRRSVKIKDIGIGKTEERSGGWDVRIEEVNGEEPT